MCLRLRYPGDQTQFLPLDSVLDTMLHELCHIVHTPHNNDFHALWNQLRDEQQGLFMKGYTGEGFLSEGRRLGGSRMPPLEARRLAREAAEKRQRQATGTGPGQRLGGAAPRPGQDIRRVIVDAVQRRNKTLKGCGTERLSDTQIRNLADTATRNGFRTQAEEDEANEVAIAQAMWELVQEDEMAKYGTAYIPPSAANPAGNRVGSVMPGEPGPSSFVDPDRNPQTHVEDVAAQETWTCGVCTLQNPPNFLCCDACGTERTQHLPKRVTSSAGPQSRSPNSGSNSNRGEIIDLTSSPPRDHGGGKRRQMRAEPQQRSPSNPTLTVAQTWQCSFCGQEMERLWWTCSVCGRMKDNSR